MHNEIIDLLFKSSKNWNFEHLKKSLHFRPQQKLSSFYMSVETLPTSHLPLSSNFCNPYTSLGNWTPIEQKRCMRVWGILWRLEPARLDSCLHCLGIHQSLEVRGGGGGGRGGGRGGAVGGRGGRGGLPLIWWHHLDIVNLLCFWTEKVFEHIYRFRGMLREWQKLEIWWEEVWGWWMKWAAALRSLAANLGGVSWMLHSFLSFSWMLFSQQ